MSVADGRLYRYGKGMPKVSAKNQITLPVAALSEAGLRAGDEVEIEATGDGELVVRRAGRGIEQAFGIFTGLYPPDYLERLDAEDAERERRR
jgi:AbrB family looped-hinge helix DNA binding protein